VVSEARAWLARGSAGATEGGEALLDAPVVEGKARWHVLWTRSHCEQQVYDQLAERGFHLFLPKIEVWSRRGGLRHLIRILVLSVDLLRRSVAVEIDCTSVAAA